MKYDEALKLVVMGVNDFHEAKIPTENACKKEVN